MFRARTVIRSGCRVSCFDRETVKNEKTGFCESRLVDACRNLPPLENFDLKTMVEAGVDLKRQNSQLFDTRPNDLSAYEGKDVEITEET